MDYKMRRRIYLLFAVLCGLLGVGLVLTAYAMNGGIW
jgi:hypothetical protein